jgi:hypothetical protein
MKLPCCFNLLILHLKVSQINFGICRVGYKFGWIICCVAGGVWLLPLLWCRGGMCGKWQVPKAWVRIFLGCRAVENC